MCENVQSKREVEKAEQKKNRKNKLSHHDDGLKGKLQNTKLKVLNIICIIIKECLVTFSQEQKVRSVFDWLFNE